MKTIKKYNDYNLYAGSHAYFNTEPAHKYNYYSILIQLTTPTPSLPATFPQQHKRHHDHNLPLSHSRKEL